jgi:LPS-assembly protein
MSSPVRWLLIAAASLPATTTAQGLGLKLRPETQLSAPAPDDKGDALLFIEADEVSGVEGKYVDAHGGVRLRTRGRTLFADHLEYSVAEDKLVASGHMRLDRRGDVLEGSRIELELEKDRGVVDSPEYYFRQLNARGKASKLFLDSKTQVRAKDGTYSTCVIPEKDWYLRVRDLKLDRDKDEGVARHATVYFKGLPILYTPYIDFPLSDARKTGFLPPTYGTTGRSGFELMLPFYLNLAPNFDATIAPRLLAKRGLMFNNEFRYLTSSVNGLLAAEYLPNDSSREDQSRYSMALRHNQRFTDRLNGYLNLQKVSDDFYFVDLSSRLATTTTTNLNREAGLSYNGGWWTLSGRTQRYQTLQDPKAPIVPPYGRVPQITFTSTRSGMAGFDASVNSEFVDFSHPSLVNGRRFVFYPSVTYPLQTSYVTVVPKLGLHYTQYDLDANATYGNSTRALPVFSVDSTLTFERNMSFLGTPLLQTLEPRLYYVYVPYRDQSALPIFDTGVGDFNMAQIFSENRFTGSDRINDANQLTAAVSSRFIDPFSGRERLRLTLGQRFYFSPQRVSLTSASAIDTRDRSDIVAAVTGRLTDAWYLDAGAQLSIDANRATRTTFGARYSPEPGHVMNFSYRESQGSFAQTDVSAQWVFNDRWSAVGRWVYSLRDRSSTTTLTGVEYNAGCWVGRFVVQQFATFTQQHVRALFFQIELNGLSKFGSNPLDILRQNITGYQKINALPQSQFNEDYYPAQ